MKLFSSLLFVILVQVSWTQDSISVLFIGNSYLSVNNLPQMVQDLTESLGDHMLMDSKMNGGFTFQSHAYDATTYIKIHSKPWNFVVLQGQSQEPSFPYDQVNQQSLPYAEQISDSVYASNGCSQVNYYMTWGRQVGDPQWDSINTFDKMNTRLRNAYLRIADSTNASVSPAVPAPESVDRQPGSRTCRSRRHRHPTQAARSGLATSRDERCPRPTLQPTHRP